MSYNLTKEYTGRTMRLLEYGEYMGEKEPIVGHYTAVKHLPKLGEILNTFSDGGYSFISSINEVAPCFFVVNSKFNNVKGMDATEEHFLWRLFYRKEEASA